MPRMLGIAFLTRKDAQPLLRCLHNVARKLNEDDFKVYRILLECVKEIAREAGQGACVTIPGFGIFGAGVLKQRGTHPRRVHPFFHGSRGFVNEVRGACELERALSTSMPRLETYRRNNHQRRTGVGQRVFTAVDEALRQAHAQMERLGGAADD